MELDRLFYPESIAVVGASPKVGETNWPFFHVLMINGYAGNLYPVNPKYEEINGIKAYKSIEHLPEGVDLLIVSIPAEKSLEVVEDAVKRKVKFVHFFTSGFSEIGNYDLEQKLVQKVRKNGTRIVGPNCIGVYCQCSRVGFGRIPQQDTPGEVAFLGQSGGITAQFVNAINSREIGLNKAVSYGNQIDLTAEEYLHYFAEDDEIKMIACYIEDAKDPKAFLAALKAATQKKPVIILKGGATEQGAQAAASHTGALASNYHIWSSAVRQHGAMLVDNFEQMMDVVMLGLEKKHFRGPRVGFLGAGGGISVLAADVASSAGLTLPELKRQTQEMIGQKISQVNTFTTNPVDLGQHGFDFNIMSHTMKAIDQDENIDVIITYFPIDAITVKHGNNINSAFEIIIQTAKELKKPVVVVLGRYSENNLDIEAVRIAIASTFRKAGLPVYTTIQDAVYSVKKYLEWSMKHSDGL